MNCTDILINNYLELINITLRDFQNNLPELINKLESIVNALKTCV